MRYRNFFFFIRTSFNQKETDHHKTSFCLLFFTLIFHCHLTCSRNLFCSWIFFFFLNFFDSQEWRWSWFSCSELNNLGILKEKIEKVKEEKKMWFIIPLLQHFWFFFFFTKEVWTEITKWQKKERKKSKTEDKAFAALHFSFSFSFFFLQKKNQKKLELVARIRWKICYLVRSMELQVV